MAAVQQLSAAYPLGSRLDEAGALEIGGCDARELAREFGTPCYVVAEDDLRARARAFRDAFRARTDRFDVLAEHDDLLATAALELPLLLLHAEGDERVPVEHSRELARAAPNARLIAVPGGHHRSVQHDGDLQAETLRWLGKVL